MDSIIVKGGKTLKGSIKISGAKNASLPAMAACLLTKEEVILSNVPNLVDIDTMKALIANHGGLCKRTGKSEITVRSDTIENLIAPYDIVRKMRASFWVLGPLLARFGYAEVSLPGGCALGSRLVDQHLAVMEALGAKIKVKNGYIVASTKKKLKGAEYQFTKVTVGATINGILAAVLADGMTILKNCAIEPEIVDLSKLLNAMGAKISGIGTDILTIEGVKELFGCRHKIIADRIEAGTYMCAVGITGGKVILENIDYALVENTIQKLEETGMVFNKLSEDKIEVIGAKIITPSNVETETFPGFATDLQAQYTALMTIASGKSIIHETIYENRYMHVPELCRMGANIHIEGHKAIVNGVDELNGAEVMATDLRASSSLIIGGLRAHGQTKVRRVYHLDRGYENLVEKLRNCGAEIERVHGDKA
ncbi:MAG: UDP-N-acetylglucosamine 1-carboxyvinyltransferase [Rickettsiaceae bacterium]|nr:UDP-N-acetylglucosamine 1-carboxyvinyltransferase [Rickettsiaceae bacterium]